MKGLKETQRYPPTHLNRPGLLHTLKTMFSIKQYVFPNHRLITVLPGHTGPVNCMAISPRGDLLASGGTWIYGLGGY